MSQSLAEIDQLFDEERFEECKKKCQVALAHNPNEAATRRLKQVIRKCDINLSEAAAEAKKEPPAAEAGAASPAAPVTEGAGPSTHVDPAPPATVSSAAPAASSAAPTAVAAAAATSSSSSVVPVNAPRFEWFQSLTTITLTFYIKGKADSDLSVTTTDRSVEVTIALGEGREYNYEIETLFNEIDVTKTTKSVRPTKIEVILTKKTSANWPTLEMKGGDLVQAHLPAAAKGAAEPPSQKHLAYPNSKGKDWSKFKLSPEEEKEQQGLNDFFKQIFRDGTDETRKAMMKSFQESGGTVLSTNWAEVGAKKVEVSPPTGMEAKQWGKDD